MPIRPATIQQFGSKFISIESSQTLDTAIEQLRVSGFRANETFLVFSGKYRKYHAVLFSELLNLSERLSDIRSREVRFLPIPYAHRVEPVDTSETGQSILDWLASHPSAVVIVRDQDSVIGVLSNPNRSPNSQDMFQQVQFSAFYPRNVEATTRYGLHVYAHILGALPHIQQDVQKFKGDMGGETPQPKISRDVGCIKPSASITVIPECDEFEFNPATFTKKWDSEWVRYDFDFRPDANLVGQTLVIQISIKVEGIEVARIRNCAIDVVDTSTEPHIVASQPITNPLAVAKLASQTSTMYQKIFVSYSRKDKEILDKYRFAQTALGNDVFIDVDSLRSGENWQARLAKAIDEADVFQLFWSENSASSEYVTYEWDYALKHKCADDRCVGFIRPVCWQQNFPSPPPQLAHLNFKYVPLVM